MSWTGPAELRVSWTGPAEAQVSWTGPAEAQVSWTGPTFGGALEALVGALECWTEPAGKLESSEEQAPEGAGEEQAPEGAGEEQAPEGAGEEQAPEGAGEEQALGLGSNPSPRMSPTSPGAHEPREVGLRWLADLREPRTAADFPRTAGLREPRTAADFPRTAGLREPQTAADFPRTAGLREPQTAADFPRTAGWASRGRRRRNPANGTPGSTAGGGGAPPSFFCGPSICHGRAAGRTRETRGKRNNGNLMTEHRIHNHIDELTDKDSGKTQGL